MLSAVEAQLLKSPSPTLRASGYSVEGLAPNRALKTVKGIFLFFHPARLPNQIHELTHHFIVVEIFVDAFRLVINIIH